LQPHKPPVGGARRNRILNGDRFRGIVAPSIRRGSTRPNHRGIAPTEKIPCGLHLIDDVGGALHAIESYSQTIVHDFRFRNIHPLRYCWSNYNSSLQWFWEYCQTCFQPQKARCRCSRKSGPSPQPPKRKRPPKKGVNIFWVTP